MVSSARHLFESGLSVSSLPSSSSSGISASMGWLNGTIFLAVPAECGSRVVCSESVVSCISVVQCRLHIALTVRCARVVSEELIEQARVTRQSDEGFSAWTFQHVFQPVLRTLPERFVKFSVENLLTLRDKVLIITRESHEIILIEMNLSALISHFALTKSYFS